MSKPSCDHENAKTPYCANCGEKLTNAKGSSVALLAHLRNQYVKAERELAKAEGRDSSNRRYADHVASAKKTLSKWAGWVEFVEKAISENGKP